MSDAPGPPAELIANSLIQLHGIRSYIWDELTAVLSRERGRTDLSESLRAGGPIERDSLSCVQGWCEAFALALLAELVKRLLGRPDRGESVRSLTDGDLGRRGPVITMLQSALDVAERRPAELPRHKPLRDSIRALMGDPDAVASMKDMCREVCNPPAPAAKSANRGAGWTRSLYILDHLQGVPRPENSPGVVSPTAEWLFEASVRIRGFLNACQRAGLVEVIHGKAAYPVTPVLLLDRLIHLEEHFWKHGLDDTVGWSVIQLGDIEMCFERLAAVTEEVFKSWGIERLLAFRGSFRVRIQQCNESMVLARMRAAGPDPVHLVTRAPFARLQGNLAHALEECACEFEKLGFDKPALFVGRQFVAAPSTLFVAEGDNPSEIAATAVPTFFPGDQTAPQDRTGSVRPDVVDRTALDPISMSQISFPATDASVRAGTPAPIRTQRKKPSRQRAMEIIAAIRSAGQPLQNKQIRDAIGLKPKTFGSLKHQLAWMVSESKELINISGSGYWVSGDALPPLDTP